MKLAIAVILSSVLWGTFSGEVGRSAPSTESAQAYWTYNRLEPDTLATAWLIERYAPEGSSVSFVEKWQSGEGIPFDIPLAKLSRTYNASSASVVASHFDVRDPAVSKLLLLIDEIEISGWSEEPSLEARDLEVQLRNIIDSAKSPESATQSAGALFRAVLATQAPSN